MTRARGKKIQVIATGGTIAERSAREAGRQHLEGDALLRGLGDIPGDITFEALDLFDLSSTFMGFDHMARMAEAARQAFAAGADGVVVTHGTDTLEESAYFVDLVSEGLGPIVFTGAMLRPARSGYDGLRNLRDALAVAASDEAAGRGVLVAFSGEIHAARDVTKAHSMATGAFKSLEFGPLGVVEEGRARFFRSLPPAAPLPRPVPRATAIVEGVKCYAAMTDIALRALAAAGIDGIVLEALGSGQVPPSIMPAIRDAVAAGLVVAATTRCPTGRVQRGGDGSGQRVAGDEHDLVAAGVLLSDLQGTKARLRLTLALSAGLQGPALAQWF